MVEMMRDLCPLLNRSASGLFGYIAINWHVTRTTTQDKGGPKPPEDKYASLLEHRN